jgi:hypothetical protein
VERSISRRIDGVEAHREEGLEGVGRGQIGDVFQDVAAAVPPIGRNDPGQNRPADVDQQLGGVEWRQSAGWAPGVSCRTAGAVEERGY